MVPISIISDNVRVGGLFLAFAVIEEARGCGGGDATLLNIEEPVEEEVNEDSEEEVPPLADDDDEDGVLRSSDPDKVLASEVIGVSTPTFVSW